MTSDANYTSWYNSVDMLAMFSFLFSLCTMCREVTPSHITIRTTRPVPQEPCQIFLNNSAKMLKSYQIFLICLSPSLEVFIIWPVSTVVFPCVIRTRDRWVGSTRAKDHMTSAIMCQELFVEIAPIEDYVSAFSCGNFWGAIWAYFRQH